MEWIVNSRLFFYIYLYVCLYEGHFQVCLHFWSSSPVMPKSHVIFIFLFGTCCTKTLKHCKTTCAESGGRERERERQAFFLLPTSLDRERLQAKRNDTRTVLGAARDWKWGNVNLCQKEKSINLCKLSSGESSEGVSGSQLFVLFSLLNTSGGCQWHKMDVKSRK